MQDDAQGLAAKQGEIEFRRLLAQQERGEALCIPEAFSAEEIIPVLRDSMAETRSVFEGLLARDITISPFLEIGAERGHRSYWLCHEHQAQGFAFDLSWDALRFGERLITEFAFTSAPHRICGDAYHLPFRSHQFPFVFCFATLHHFPDPGPVVQEVLRVLQDQGHFYFGEEPTRGRLALKLWTRRGHKLSPFEAVLNRLGILGFIVESGDLERQYGISENTFPLSTWLKLIEPFAALEMQVNRKLKLRFDPRRPSWKRALSHLVGGVTTYLGQIQKAEASVIATDWPDMLRCPTCSSSEVDSPLHLSGNVEAAALVCENCGMRYPQRDQVWLLLPRDLLETLYPYVKENPCDPPL